MLPDLQVYMDSIPHYGYIAILLLGALTSIHSAGHILTADNWFSGIAMCAACATFGVGYIGVAKANRIGGAFAKTTSAETKDMSRGFWRARASLDAMAGGNPDSDHADKAIYVYQWYDKKLVTVISTIVSPLGWILRRTRLASGESVRQPYPCPAIILAYNEAKTGVDMMDQQVACYARNRPFRWHVKALIHMVKMATHNAHTIYLEHHGLNKKKFPLVAFMMMVVDDLTPKTKVHASTDARSPPTTPQTLVTISTPTPIGHRSLKMHGDRRKACTVSACPRHRRKGNGTCSACGTWVHTPTNAENGTVCWDAHMAQCLGHH